METHEHNQRLRHAGLIPIDAAHVVSRNERHHRRVLAMCQRHTCVGSDPQGHRHSRHDFILDAGRGQTLDLFAAAAEDERIAALETNDVQSTSRAHRSSAR